MTVVRDLPRWTPEPPDDNHPTLVRWPRWRLLLDLPVPATALVVGEADPGVERWLRGTGAEVRWVGGPRGLTRPADLVIVGTDAVDAFADRHALRWLARSSTADGTVWLPWHRTPRRERALAAAGFSRRLWLADSDPVGGSRWRGPGAPGVAASRKGPGNRPPAWLALIGARVGWASPSGWSLTTPGAYPSQKAIAVLAPGRGGPGAVVKLAQDPRHDDRVRSEAVALRNLAVRAPTFARERTPAVLAEVVVGGAAGVVEQALRGRPFLEASTLRPSCPLAADAVEAATELALATLVDGSGAHLGALLADLHARFVADLRPSSAVADALAEQVAVIAGRPAVPGVVVHGDLGTWNLLVVDGRVRVLDWESARADGPPLWDLAYLARSYAVRSGRRRGLRRARAIERHLVDGSALTATMAGWFATYRRRLDLDPELGEALFHTCWMHRAVKETARLGPDATGHYGPLCAHLVEQRRARGLRQLLGT